MHVKTVQVMWHGSDPKKPEPVYSVDFDASGALYTAGGDKEIKVWKVGQGADGYPTVDYLATLDGHSRTVNCVRFSPSGDSLVSTGDGGEILLWKLADAGAPCGGLGDDPTPWRRVASLRGHNDDVMDVSWSTDGTALVSGSIDNKSIIWDMSDKRRGAMLHQLKEHRHYTQGVAWDPAQQFIVTQSADQTCMVHALRPAPAGKKGKVQQLLPACESSKEFHTLKLLKKRAMGAAAGGGESEKHALFQDESVLSFFRRLAWSPDGSFLAVPAGQYKASADSKAVNTAYIYARNKWSSPLLHLPGHSKPVVAVRFCPLIFKRDEEQAGGREGAPASALADAAVEGEQQGVGGQAQASAASALPFDLPYKMVFAVATLDSVVVYSTEGMLPLAVLGQLHYDSITDLAWSSDGRVLAVSSRDCYCSIACFEEGELGTPVAPEELPPHIAARMAAAQHMAPPPPAAQGPLAKAAQPKVPAASQRLVPSPIAAPRGGAALELAAAVGEQPGASGPPPQAGGAAAAAPAPIGSTQQAAIGKDGRKRIQAEPVALVGQQQQQQAQPEAKRKRITPEAVGPAPAVVGDSQAGTQVFASVPCEEHPGQQQPAAKKPKRIVPEPVGPVGAPAPAGAASLAPGAGSTASEGQPPASHGNSAAGQPAAPAPRMAKRITPIPIVPAQQQQQQGESAPRPTESGSMVGAASKQAKRITPTPLKAGEAVSEQFENAKQVSYPLPASESSRDGFGAQNVRRITPVPLTAASPLPDVADSRPSAAAAAVGASGAESAGQSIAALAMLAGQKAARLGMGQ